MGSCLTDEAFATRVLPRIITSIQISSIVCSHIPTVQLRPGRETAAVEAGIDSIDTGFLSLTNSLTKFEIVLQKPLLSPNGDKPSQRFASLGNRNSVTCNHEKFSFQRAAFRSDFHRVTCTNAYNKRPALAVALQSNARRASMTARPYSLCICSICGVDCQRPTTANESVLREEFQVWRPMPDDYPCRIAARTLSRQQLPEAAMSTRRAPNPAGRDASLITCSYSATEPSPLYRVRVGGDQGPTGQVPSFDCHP